MVGGTEDTICRGDFSRAAGYQEGSAWKQEGHKALLVLSVVMGVDGGCVLVVVRQLALTEVVYCGQTSTAVLVRAKISRQTSSS